MRILDIYRMPLEQRKIKYGTTDIQKVIIDGNVFSGYKTYTFFWEKEYLSPIKRSGNGSINNLNGYASFITPHLEINYSMISIDDYRRIQDLVLSKNEFTVTCYDVVTGKSTTNKMYFAPDQLPKVFALPRVLQGQSFVEVTGIQNYKVEMIGTNSDNDKFIDVNYHSNYPANTQLEDRNAIIKINKGVELLIGKDADNIQKDVPVDKTNKKVYKFKNWCVSPKYEQGKTFVYVDNQEYTINEPNNADGVTLDLYAQWE